MRGNMLSAPFLVISSLLLADAMFLSSSIPDPLVLFGIPWNLWHCGDSDYIRMSAIKTVSKDCPGIAVDFNHCCAAHDDCYANQMGQTKCDDTFCECLDQVARWNQEIGKCENKTRHVCSAVRMFGQSSYDSPKNLSLPPIPIEERQVPKIEKIALKYVKLYDECASQNRTIASCALNYDICVERKPKRCELGLLRCLENTQFARNDSIACDQAIDDVIAAIVSTEEPQGSVTVIQGHIRNITIYQQVWRQLSRPSSPIILVVTLFAMLFLLSIICLVIVTRVDNAIILDGPPVLVADPSSRVGSTTTSRF